MTLNPRQRDAVEYIEGPLQVVAGPGTGKTRVITEKVVHLTTQLRHPAGEILALTFTEKAAQEMAGRIRAALAKAGVKGQPQVSTFHSFCLYLLQEHHHRVGYDREPQLLVGPLYTQFIAHNVDALVTTHTDLVGKVNRFAADLSKFVSLCHDERLIDADLPAKVGAWLAEEVGPKDAGAAKRVSDLAASVPVLLEIQRRENIVAYGDLVTLAVRLLAENEDLRADVAARYRYVLVDEYQDNNRAQSELVRLLAGGHRKVCVVGDEDQSIYRFRGARPGIMNAFLEEWADPETGAAPKVVTLEENYRSTAAIIDAGQALIGHNTERPGHKALRRADASTAAGADDVHLARADADVTERAFVRQEIARATREGRPAGDIAILTRSLSHVDLLVSELRHAGIGVEVVGGGGLFTNAAVREVLAWLKALDDSEGQEVALHRVVRMQNFGLTHEDQRLLGRAAREGKVPFASVLDTLHDPARSVVGVSAHGHARVRGFLRIQERFRVSAQPQVRPDVTGLILEILDLTGTGRALRPDDAQGRQGLAAIGGLLQAAQNYQDHFPYPSLHGFVRHLDLLEELGHDDTIGEASNDPSTVKVMTVHQSKGREFPLVIIPHLHRYPPENRREWPRKFLDHVTLAGGDVKAVHREEERRVLYVAMTRAMAELILSDHAARSDGAAVEPSEFLEEIRPKARVVEIDAAHIEPPGAAADAHRTRRGMEARLTFLVSRLGSHAEGHDLEATLGESIRIVSGLLADGAEGGVEAVERALKNLGVALPPAVRHLEPDRPSGPTGTLYLSASSLKVYEDCPRQFYYKQVVRIPESASFEARLGTAIHEALELFHKEHAEPDPALYDTLLGLFEEKLSEVEFSGEVERVQALGRGREILARYLAEEKARGVKVRDVEKEFRVTLGDDVVLSGKIDRIDEMPDGTVRVVDYKTGKVDSRPDYLRGFQMPIYAWAAQEELGHKLHSVEVIGLKELKVLKDGPRLNRQELPWEDGSTYALTQERIESVKKSVAEVVVGIRRGEFDPKPDERRCGWCAYKLLCGSAFGVDDETADRAGATSTRGTPP